MLLDPHSPFAIQSMRIEDVVQLSTATVLGAQKICFAMAAAAMAPPTGNVYSFADLSDALVTLDNGLLIGWRRNRGEVVINPGDKSRPVPWQMGDELVVIKSKASSRE